jgi:hypothetical protein
MIRSYERSSKILKSEGLYKFYSSPNITRKIGAGMRWMEDELPDR